MLDASLLSMGETDPAGRDLVRTLMAEPVLAGVVLVRGGRAERWQPAGGPVPSFEPLRQWLLGQGPRPSDPVQARAPRLRLPYPLARATLPPHAILLKPGLSGWDDPGFAALLRARPDVAAMAVLATPLARDWPEYADPSEVEALPRRADALARLAHAILVADEAAAASVSDWLPRARDRLALVAPPSLLGGASARPPDAELAAVPFFVAFDSIEARANTTLLLQVWRDLLQGGGPVPKLVLAGARGAQLEEIRPLLQWSDKIRAVVAEVPGLPAPALRQLASHARAVLAPGFAGTPGALLRDLAALGVPVLAAQPGGLSPIDGPGWRTAIHAAASRRPPPSSAAALIEPAGLLEALAGLVDAP